MRSTTKNSFNVIDRSMHRGRWTQSADSRIAFYRSHNSLGMAAHWIKEAGILAPIVIGEFVPDPARKWRYIKLASLATALLSEGMWTFRIHKEREAAGHRKETYVPSSERILYGR